MLPRFRYQFIPTKKSFFEFPEIRSGIIILGIALSLSPYSGFAQTDIGAASVSGTWHKSKSPYIINGDIIIDANAKLIIEPGVTVKFSDQYSITVNGCLHAVGNATDSIKFTALDTTGFASGNSVGWNGIRFENVTHADSSKIQFAIFEFSKHSNSGGALWLDGFGSIDLRNNSFRYNQAYNGAAISLNDVENLELVESTFSNNLGDNYGGAIWTRNSTVNFVNCKFLHNEAHDGGAFYFRESQIHMVRCIVVNNEAYRAGAIKAHWSNTIDIHNSTLAGNRGAPDGINLYRSDLNCVNTILWNKTDWNTYEEINDLDYSNVSLSYCIIKGPINSEWKMQDCFNQDPQFVDLPGSDVGLSWSNYPIKDESRSIAIDQGDISSQFDPDGTRADIGAVSYSQDSNAFPNAMFSADTTMGVVPFSVYFADLSSQAEGDITEWYWDFGDGTTASDQHPVHEYTESGVFNVRLVVTNQDGKKDTITQSEYVIALSGTVITSDQVEGTWTTEASPYYIFNDIEIPNGSRLIIKPGVSVQFFGHYRILVNGSLEAIGTESDSITFTRFDENSNWHSIRLENTPSENDSTILSYCKIEYATYLGGNVTTNGGNALYVKDFHKVRISHSLLQNNIGGRGAGIYCAGSNIKIHNNTIINNSVSQYGGGINVEDSSPTIYDNLIANNYAGNSAGGISLSNSQAIVKNNIIRNNSCYWTGAGVVIKNSSDLSLNRNIIAFNESGHDNGGGVAIYSSSPEVINNTIVYNKAQDGEGVYINGVSYPDFINNIIYFNRDRYADANDEDEMYLDSDNSDPNFYNCDIQGGISGIILRHGTLDGIAADNIASDPLFQNPEEFNFALSWENYPTNDDSRSPCIDAGYKESEHDPDGSIADIGAIYFDQPGAEFPPNALFSIDTLLGFNELKVHLTDMSYPGSKPINEWYWDFGDGNTSTSQNPVHTYKVGGEFTVSLTITDENGNKDSMVYEKPVRIYEGTYITGELSEELTDSVYLVGGDLVIPDGMTTTIDSGVKFIFFGNYRVEVHGALQALGSEEERIVFTYFDTLGMDLGNQLYYGYTAGWAGIQIKTEDQNDTYKNDSTILNHCLVEFVSSQSSGAINCYGYSAQIRISNTEIRYNATHGIHTQSWTAAILQNYIHHNYTTLYGSGAGINCSNGSPLIQNNIICSNHANDDGGGISVRYSNHPLLINNVICHNTAYRGGAIGNYAGGFTAINNTICFNTAENGDGGGYIVHYADDVVFINSILYGNSPDQVNIGDQYTKVGFENTALENGKNGVTTYYPQNIAPYENVFEEDPMVANEVSEHARLLYGSSMIDAGRLEGLSNHLPSHDVLGNTRIINGKVDIGAFEFAPQPITVISPLGYYTKNENFDKFVINLDTIFYSPHGNEHLDYSISNNDEVTLVDARITDHKLEINSVADAEGSVTLSIRAADNYHEAYDSLNLIILENEVLTTQALAENALVIYPNPASEKIIIENNWKKEATISLYTSDGRRVKYASMTEDISVELTDLTPGIYFIQVVVKDKVYVGKVIISN